MNINDAVAFFAVLAFGSAFGALGAFLALPVTASSRPSSVPTPNGTIWSIPLLMNDPVPEKKSKVVEGAEAISERVLHHIPRAVQGSTAHAGFRTRCVSCRNRRTISARQMVRMRLTIHRRSPSRRTRFPAQGGRPLKGTDDAPTTIREVGGAKWYC